MFMVRKILFLSTLLLTSCVSSSSLTEESKSKYPKASENADVALQMISNTSRTTFYVDDKKIATGKNVKVLIDEKPHTVTADPEGYRPKETYIQPPYLEASPVRFTFMVEDKVAENNAGGDQEERSRSSEQSSAEAESARREAENDEPAAPAIDFQVPMTAMDRPDDVAVVLGNRNYENSDVPDVDYAVRDAQTIKKYLVRTLGFHEENVIYVENADAAAMKRIFGTTSDAKGQLYDWVKPGDSDVFVYYSGHGAPNPESETAYLVPVNSNPNYLSQNGYPVDQLYENLSQVPAESVTVVMEACFSGVSDGGAVVQDISPAVLSVENPVMAMENGLAFTAGTADQVSTWYSEKKHGLFTYYFLKGLRGAADVDRDQTVTAGEMGTYLKEKVPYRAQRMHSRKQTPQVVGEVEGRVLVQYDGSAPFQN